MGGKPELVLDARALLGEGAIWDARRGVLHWVDIEGFLTTARHGLDQATLTREPLSGGLFRVQPGVSGLASVEFAG